MTSNIEPDEFQQKWKTHTQELIRLKSNLPRDRWDEVNDLQKQIDDLVQDASENIDKGLKEMEK